MEADTTSPAPGWVVHLSGHPVDLEHWHRSLKEPFDPWCERIPNGADVVQVLRSQSFVELETAQQVHERALPLIERLNGAIWAVSHTKPVSLGAIGHIGKQGERSVYITARADNIELRGTTGTATAQVRNPDGSLPPPAPPRPSDPQRWIAAAERDDHVADMLAFAGRSENWFDIFKAIEMAELIAGKKRELPKRLGDSARAFKNMRRTANFYRHAPKSPKTDRPPPVLTPLPDAKALLSYAIRVLLAEMAGGV